MIIHSGVSYKTSMRGKMKKRHIDIGNRKNRRSLNPSKPHTPIGVRKTIFAIAMNTIVWIGYALLRRIDCSLSHCTDYEGECYS